MQDEKLNEIKRRIDVTYQGDRNLAVMLQDVIYLYKKLEESVPLDGTVMPKIAEIDFGINELENIKDYLDDNDIYFVNQRIAELEKKKSNFTV